MKTKRDLSVRMETLLVIRIGGCTHRLTLDRARDLNMLLSKFLKAKAQTAEAKKVRAIQECVMEHYGLNCETFASVARDETYAWPRQVAMFLSREMVPALSRTEIGNEFGRDSSTVSHAVNRVSDRMSVCPKSKSDVEALRRKLSSNGHNILK